MNNYNNYDKSPTTKIKGYDNAAFSGAKQIADEIKKSLIGSKKVLFVDCYCGVDYQEIKSIFSGIDFAEVFCIDDCAISKADYKSLISDYLTEDRVFGYICPKKIESFFDVTKLSELKQKILSVNGNVLVYGAGASLVSTDKSTEICVYADLARWEIQLRYRSGLTNWNTDNADAPILSKYKQGFFIEWRAFDRHKQAIANRVDYILDTNKKGEPKMITATAFFAGLKKVSTSPFRTVPYFDPGVWGGQWMKQVCDLDKSQENFAWSFDGVPEENSLYLQYGDVTVEVPAIDAVFFEPRALLGERVHARYGAEFPIRFDFLDTIGGQNLSLQVHPLTEYIQQTFGMHYTQDESYYILDVDETKDNYVYLGLKNGINKDDMLTDLNRAQEGEISFPADKYVNKIKASKHDHFLIPAGTVHCSGAGTMVLEISATPYIFTFKLWDWDRLGLDGLPRPIHIEHGSKVIDWSRDTDYVTRELVNHFETLYNDGECIATKTGLHEREPIETVTHRSKTAVKHSSNGSVCMLNLVEGAEAVVASTDGSFEPFVVHYAETFIIPASVKEYTISPYGKSIGSEIMTIKAYIK